MTETKPYRPYALMRPCAKCPFRKDMGYLRRERANEISRSIQEGGEFHCHETTVSDPTDESGMMSNSDSKVCAGSLIIMEKTGQPNQGARIAERLGLYDPSRLDMDAPVADSFVEWVRQHGEDPDDDGLEHCEVVGDECEDPPGYSAGSGAVENSEPGTCERGKDDCRECGSLVCADCRVEDDDVAGPLCLYCGGEDE